VKGKEKPCIWAGTFVLVHLCIIVNPIKFLPDSDSKKDRAVRSNKRSCRSRIFSNFGER